MNRFNFKNYQSMNLIHKNEDGNQLWLGDYGAATDLNLLKQKKIKHVLTAAAMLNINYPKQNGINHKVIHAFDLPTYKMTPHFDEAFSFIQQGLKSGNILVHCAAGISRSTTCVLVYLMKTKQMTFKQALELTRAKRPIVNPNYGFQNQLSRYETFLKKGGKSQTKKSTNIQKKQNPNKQVQEEKNAVLNFISQEKVKNRLNSTVGGSKDTKLNTYTNQGKIQNVRGKSQNYRATMQADKVNGAKLANHFLTFKLETPKIVTIKR